MLYNTNVLKASVLNGFITSIKSGIKKLNKYFLRRLTNNSIEAFKPYIISIILDLKFKVNYFKKY